MRRVAASLIAALAIWACADAATASSDGQQAGAGGSIGGGTPEVVVVAGGGGQSTRVPVGDGGGGGGGSTWQCQFVHATGAGVTSEPFTPQPGETALFVCYDAGRLVSVDARTYDPADPLAGLFAAERAMAAARRRVDPPRPDLRLNPAADQLVGVPTWLWLAGGWGPVSATAAVGAVSATVTATPTGVAWDTGDGTVLRCAGPGRAWAPGLDDAGSDCRHTYVRRSTEAGPDATFTVRATVTYAVAWTATTGQGGDLGTITRTATVDVRVREAQAAIR